ncbi:MAG: CtpA [uncultured bacterium (gcode 4)]|uniref:CtpA n=1 Tax=uncultured bacterium (gcode 4) TaxID=1234023 RepID=K2GD57_9BACT|nr:MAG: CtpA [uncultured bacterium (gcode 4)]
MKNLLKKLSIILLIILSTSLVNAADDNKVWDYLDNQKFTESQKNKNLTMQWLFLLYFNAIWEWIPESYRDIELKFKNVSKWTLIYDALQKWVYLDLIKNRPIDLQLNKTAPQSFFAKLVKANFDLDMQHSSNSPIKLRYFLDIMYVLKNESEPQEPAWTPITWAYEIESVSNFPILNDVFKKIKTQHYDSSKFKDEELVQWAIKWMSDAAWDKYTTYFPPIEAKNFTESLNWEFEGIGANVDMEKPWMFIIVAPLKGSPAEKAWLKAWDRVTKVDNFEITEKVTLQEAVWKVKWPAGSVVTLSILRNWSPLEIKVTRAKISVPNIEYTVLPNWDNYIHINTFWEWVARAFSWIIGELAKKNSDHKTIIDLRNNPGWSLDEVNDMLEFFVPKWKSVVNIKYKNYSSDILALWDKWFTFLNKKVIILINKWSASASEIMAWTIKDYLWDNVKIIWEQSYGKGSVQSLDDYSDGSSFKYTIAKWFTWKTQTWIDWVWIKPDIEIVFDENQNKNWIDNQLEYAKSLGF